MFHFVVSFSYRHQTAGAYCHLSRYRELQFSPSKIEYETHPCEEGSHFALSNIALIASAFSMSFSNAALDKVTPFFAERWWDGNFRRGMSLLTEDCKSEEALVTLNLSQARMGYIRLRSVKLLTLAIAPSHHTNTRSHLSAFPVLVEFSNAEKCVPLVS